MKLITLLFKILRRIAFWAMVIVIVYFVFTWFNL